MARSRFFFFEALRRMGTSLFNFFSRCEERGVMPGAARWVKTTFLGAFVVGISALSAASLVNCITCYAPVDPYPRIQYVKAEPNPTRGADTVTVTAGAKINEAAGTTISGAMCFIVYEDTLEMEPSDGKFDSKEEDFRLRLYVGDREPQKVFLRIAAANDKGLWGNTEQLELEITE